MEEIEPGVFRIRDDVKCVVSGFPEPVWLAPEHAIESFTIYECTWPHIVPVQAEEGSA